MTVTSTNWQRVQALLTAEYSAPSAGPPPWCLYRITSVIVYAFGTIQPFGATGFDLGGSGD